MIRNLNRLALVFLIAFTAVALSLTYWSVIASDTMLGRADNPRRVEAERAILRGAIYDRKGQLLAETVRVGKSPSGQPIVRRNYPHPETVTAVGYYSLIHGVGGIESADDGTLRGDELRGTAQAVVDQLFHRPQVGSDLRLTLDAGLQGAIANVLKGHQGAAIAIEVPSGAVLAMFSAPGFDPNKLDVDYDTLLKDPAAPLLNRVTQGVYQPGGALETVILAALLSNKHPLDQPVPDVAAPVKINDLTLTCAAPSPSSPAPTIDGAYGMACPALFADAVSHDPGPTEIQKMLSAFGLLQPPQFAGFEIAPSAPLVALTPNDTPARLRARGIGQDGLTVTPLQMAMVAATIANRGNAIAPYLADAVRKPGTTEWQSMPAPQDQTAVITQEVADGLSAAMRDAVTKGAAQAADHAGLAIYGHASIAYTGKNADSWFIGFIALPGGRSVAMAVVIENTVDAAAVARIGGLALSAAQ